MNLKEFKKIIKVCRELGVVSYKDNTIEFVLTPEAPVTKAEKKINASQDMSHPDISTDVPTGEALLFWSTTDLPENEEATQ